MKKRDFLGASVLGATVLPQQLMAQQTSKIGKGPTLLTITGSIGKANRGAIDTALDQLMAKQKIAFDRAFAFDFQALSALPAVSIKPTLEYDNKVHVLQGPLLGDVVRVAGAAQDGGRLLLRAIDGYGVLLSWSDAVKYRFIIATHLDGHPLPLGGLGPLWAVYDADRFADQVSKPVTERFALCPWGLYHIEVQRG